MVSVVESYLSRASLDSESSLNSKQLISLYEIRIQMAINSPVNKYQLVQMQEDYLLQLNELIAMSSYSGVSFLSNKNILERMRKTNDQNAEFDALLLTLVTTKFLISNGKNYLSKSLYHVSVSYNDDARFQQAVCDITTIKGIEIDELVDDLGNFKVTALHIATAYCQVEAVRALLDAQASPYIVSGSSTPLQMAKKMERTFLTKKNHTYPSWFSLAHIRAIIVLLETAEKERHSHKSSPNMTKNSPTCCIQ